MYIYKYNMILFYKYPISFATSIFCINPIFIQTTWKIADTKKDLFVKISEAIIFNRDLIYIIYNLSGSLFF